MKRKCRICGCIIKDDNIAMINHLIYCKHCANVISKECSKCGIRIMNSDVVYTYTSRDGSRIILCETCRNTEEYRNDVRLGASSVYDDTIEYEEEYDEEDEEEYDEESCRDRSDNRGILNYGYKPNPIFYATSKEVRKKKNLYLGIELEVEHKYGRNSKGYDASQIVDKYGRSGKLFYVKSDGSLSDGMEIVTHPCTMEYHVKVFPWKHITEYLLGNGYLSHKTTTCGLHMHINRAFFDYTGCIKVGLFFHMMRPYIKKISRRDGCGYANYCDMIGSDERDLLLSPYGDDRYEAVNFSANGRKTIELRMFRGTLKYETILGSIQFVDGAVKYLESVSLKYLYDMFASKKYDILWESFLNYLSTEWRGKYNHFINYAIKLDICEKEKGVVVENIKDGVVKVTKKEKKNKRNIIMAR